MSQLPQLPNPRENPILSAKPNPVMRSLTSRKKKQKNLPLPLLLPLKLLTGKELPKTREKKGKHRKVVTHQQKRKEEELGQEEEEEITAGITGTTTEVVVGAAEVVVVGIEGTEVTEAIIETTTETEEVTEAVTIALTGMMRGETTGKIPPKGTIDLLEPARRPRVNNPKRMPTQTLLVLLLKMSRLFHWTFFPPKQKKTNKNFPNDQIITKKQKQKNSTNFC